MINHPSKPKYITTYANTTENQIEISHELETTDWNALLKTRLSENPDTNYNIFINKFLEIKNKYMPKKIVKFKPYKHKLNPWMNESLIQKIKQKDKLYKKWKSTYPNNPMCKTYKENFQTFSDKVKKRYFPSKT